MSEHEQTPGVEEPSSVQLGEQMTEEAEATEQAVVDDLQAHATAPENQPQEASMHVDRFEAAWMRIAVAVLAVFLLAVTLSSFAVGIQLPGVYERMDPNSLNDPGNPFADPGLRELAPGKYEAYFRSQIWAFTPNEIRVPAGSEVTFYVSSQDVLHGFKITETNVNVMVLPGQVSTLKHTFEEPGEYQIICHEYCGQLHHTMYATIFVEDAETVAEAP